MIQTLQTRCGTDAQAKGWHDYYNSLPPGGDAARDHIITKLALIDCEVAEAIEEIRNGNDLHVYYTGTDRKPEGFPTELADVIIRTLDLAEMLGVDLSAVIDEKLAYNQTRAHMHGKVV